MPEKTNNNSADLQRLLPIPPEAILSSFQMEMRMLLDPVRINLQTIADEELSKEEHDELIAMMQNRTERMNDAIILVLRYLKAKYEPNAPASE